MFKDGDGDPKQILLMGITSITNNKPFFDQPVIKKQDAYSKRVKISRNNDYIIGDLLDYLFQHKYYKLIGINLSRQRNKCILQQIKFVRKLEEHNVASMIFYRWRAAKNYSKLFFRFINCNRTI